MWKRIWCWREKRTPPGQMGRCWACKCQCHHVGLWDCEDAKRKFQTSAVIQPEIDFINGPLLARPSAIPLMARNPLSTLAAWTLFELFPLSLSGRGEGDEGEEIRKVSPLSGRGGGGGGHGVREFPSRLGGESFAGKDLFCRRSLFLRLAWQRGLVRPQLRVL